MNRTSNERRLATIQDLVEFSSDLEKIANCLKDFEWDYTGIQFVLSRNHIAQVLNRYMKDEIDAGTVENWANLIECRDDIDFASEQTGEIIHELANPYLTQPLDKKRAQELIQMS